MSLITRTYVFTDGTTAYGSQVNSEIANIVNTINSLDNGGTTWTTVKVTTLLPQADVNMNAHQFTSLGTPTTAGQAAIYPITSSQITDGTITGTDIAAATIAASNIISGTITTTQIASSTITGSNIASDAALAGNPTTTTQASNNSSTRIATTAFANPASSVAATGYQKLASGIIMQWGTISLTNGSGNRATPTFPLTFPTAVWNIQVTAESTGGNGISAWKIVTGSITTGQFTLQNNDTTTAFTGYWFAIGN